MRKKEAMAHWRGLSENQNPLKHMTPVPYKATGSKFGACGIRIDGNPEFINAVLSNLKPLLEGENNNTRLELMRNEVKPSTVKGETKNYDNAAENAEVCYIRLHRRGRDAKAMNNIFNVYKKE